MQKKKLFFGVVAGALGFWAVRSYLRSDGTRGDTVAHMKHDAAQDVRNLTGFVKRLVRKTQTRLSAWAREDAKNTLPPVPKKRVVAAREQEDGEAVH